MGRKKKAVEQAPFTNAAPAVEQVTFAPEMTKDAPAGAFVTFTGDPRGGKDPEAPVYGGKAFPKGKAVEVDADWLKANANIRKNTHFKVE